MYWRLSAQVTACTAAGRVILLDLERDRYFCVPDRDSPAVAAWLEDPDGHALSPALRSLVQDAARTTDLARPLPVPFERPSSLDSTAPSARAVGLATVIGVAMASRSAFRDVRRLPLAVTIAKRVPTAAAAGDAGRARFSERLQRYWAARPLVPVPRVCLHDCLALLDWLGSARTGCSLVFGVSAFPFAAHSWIQRDGVVIDDHPDSVSRFEPILHFE